jgi:hypothetical protein
MRHFLFISGLFSDRKKKGTTLSDRSLSLYYKLRTPISELFLVSGNYSQEIFGF